MTKQQRQTQNAIAEIMAVAGRSQAQLAKDIGASINTVKSWTRRKNPLAISYDFRKRIFAAYGALILINGKLVSFPLAFDKGKVKEKPFTKESLQNWRKYLENTKRADYAGNASISNYFTDKGCDLTRRIFNAAWEKDNGRNERFFAVVESFNKWAIGAIETFSLSKTSELRGADLESIICIPPSPVIFV